MTTDRPTHAILLTVLAATLIGQTRADAWTFTSVADSTGAFASFSAPAVGSNGRVIFRAVTDAGVTGVYDGPSVTGNRILETGSVVTAIDPVISAAGTHVAYRATLTGGRSAIVRDATVFADTSGPYASFGDAPAVDAAGNLLFAASTDVSPTATQLYRGTDPNTSRFGAGGGISSFGNRPDLSPDGDIAFRGELVGLPGLFRGPDPVADAYIVTGGVLSTVGTAPTINDASMVAFTAADSAGMPGVYRVATPGTADRIADASGSFDSFADGVGVDAAGNVAFLATLDLSGLGIYDGPDPALDAIVRTGDALLGSSITNLSFFRGLGEDGTLAFAYTLANGVSGIASGTCGCISSLGDANGDGVVDVTDLGVFAANFRLTVSSGPAQGDFNCDGVVNVSDLGIIAANFRSRAAEPTFAQAAAALGLPAIPEPASLGLPIALATGLRRRRV